MRCQCLPPLLQHALQKKFGHSTHATLRVSLQPRVAETGRRFCIRFSSLLSNRRNLSNWGCFGRGGHSVRVAAAEGFPCYQRRVLELIGLETAVKPGRDSLA